MHPSSPVSGKKGKSLVVKEAASVFVLEMSAFCLMIEDTTVVFALRILWSGEMGAQQEISGLKVPERRRKLVKTIRGKSSQSGKLLVHVTVPRRMRSTSKE